jgi:TRAP-type C4-dicarboxylate transport system substrate-binding protein
MKTIPVLVPLLAFASIATPAARADEPITLRFAMTSPQAGWSWQKWFGPRWIPAVEKASDGTLKIQPYFGVTLANMLNAYDRTVSGVADLAYSVTGTMRGKFPKTNVIELPNDSNGREASGALWKLYESGLTSAEWSDTVPLYLYVYSQSVFHFQKPVTKLEDIKGMKIGATSKVTADTIERLGAAPVTTSPAEMYEVLQRRTITGMAMGWNGVLSFKLPDVTNYHVNVQLGSGGGFMIANKDVYAKLPARAKAALDANSGYVVSKAFGDVIDANAAEQFETVKNMPGQTQAFLPPEEKRRWQERSIAMIDEWVRATPDGATVLAAYRKGIADIRAGM